jgi:EAL domain-containing protein (putative c-di-GMP-specific phosphodiesterase class I)
MLFTAVQGEIGFEITETAMIADPVRALENLRTIADAGIKLAIDDYGSGFSSLAYLQQLPVSELKIDKIFISRLASGQRDPLLVRSTIELAHALEMEVTAEGVDSPEALALLQVMGCDLLQGFHLSRPLPFDKLVTYLDAESANGGQQLASPHQNLRMRLARAG